LELIICCICRQLQAWKNATQDVLLHFPAPVAGQGQLTPLLFNALGWRWIYQRPCRKGQHVRQAILPAGQRRLRRVEFGFRFELIVPARELCAPLLGCSDLSSFLYNRV
jgi:hypothetical protein